MQTHIFPSVHQRSKPSSCQVLIRRSQLWEGKIMICLRGLETAACCICRTHVSKHKLNEGNSSNLPAICLPCPAVEKGQVQSQCWPCVLKIDSVNNQITSCANCFCWNHISRICRKTILALHWPTPWTSSVTSSFTSSIMTSDASFSLSLSAWPWASHDFFSGLCE